MKKNLSKLVNLLIEKRIQGRTDLTITDITADSRKVVPGSLFIALRGAKVDGHKYLEDAIKAGAVAVLVDNVPNERIELAKKFAAKYLCNNCSRYSHSDGNCYAFLF